MRFSNSNVSALFFSIALIDKYHSIPLMVHLIWFFNSSSSGACNFMKKETLTQVFSCEFFKISKNTFLTEHLWANASEPQHTYNKLAVYNRPVWPFYVTSNTNKIINSRGYHRNLALYQQTFEIFFS